MGNVSLHIEFSSIFGISLNSHKVNIIIQKAYMNVCNYDYLQTLEISKQRVHRSLCGNTERGMISYNEIERRGQINHRREQRVNTTAQFPSKDSSSFAIYALKSSVSTKSNWAHCLS